MISRDEVLRRSTAAGDRIPLLTIDEFFDGNEVEDSIAPNQFGFGRPSLDEIADRLRELAAVEDVAWVRVQLHEEMFEGDGQDVLAESIAICTSLSEDEIDELLDPESLEAGPTFDGLSYDVDQFSDMPPVPDGHRLVTLGWD